jgi:zinc finger protein
MPTDKYPTVKPATPTKLFEYIGNKVDGLVEAINSDVDHSDGCKAVEEIESLCMNCGKNVTHISASLIHER